MGEEEEEEEQEEENRDAHPRATANHTHPMIWSSRYAKDPAGAVEAITKFGVEVGDQLTKDWLQFWMFLFATTRDGFTTTPSKATLCDVNGPVDKLKGACATKKTRGRRQGGR